MIDKHMIKSLIVPLMISCLAIIIVIIGAKNCICYEHDLNEYGVPMVIEDGWGNKYEYVRPVQEGEVLLKNPLLEKTECVYNNWWYVKLTKS